MPTALVEGQCFIGMKDIFSRPWYEQSHWDYVGRADKKEHASKGQSSGKPRKRGRSDFDKKDKDENATRKRISAIAEAIFEIYFRVLKHTADSCTKHQGNLGNQSS